MPSGCSHAGFASTRLKSVNPDEWGAIHGAKTASDDEADDDEQPADGDRATQKALAQEPTAARARIDDRRAVRIGDRAHEIRILGFSSE